MRHAKKRAQVESQSSSSPPPVSSAQSSMVAPGSSSVTVSVPLHVDGELVRQSKEAVEAKALELKLL